MDDRYWASETGLDLAEACYDRIRTYYTELPNSLAFQRWSDAYRAYYGLSGVGDPFDVSQIGITGDKGQLTSLRINHAGNIGRHALALITQTMPEFEVVPQNSDYKSIAQASLGKKLVDYFMDTKGVAAKLFECAEGAIIFGESSLAIEWDPLAGPKLKQPDPLLPTRTKVGDLSFRVFTPLDMPRDRFRYDQEHDWVFTRRFVNKWDLAARYPGTAKEIITLKRQGDQWSVPTGDRIDTERQSGQDKSDLIPMYTLYHRRTDAMPEGKIAMLCDADTLFYEGPLPYDEVPIVSICPGKMIRTPYGDSFLHHILALQQVYDHIASSVASNNVAFATQVILMPDNADYHYNELHEGLAVLNYNPGPEGRLEPKALNLTAPNAEGLKFMELLVKEMETLSAISATQRGVPQPNIRSGNFAALVSQQALTYAGAFQLSFQQAVAKTGDSIIALLKQFADRPMVAEIGGKSHFYQMKEFTSQDLDLIHRVVVKSGSAAARTAEFAIAAADALLQRGVITNVKDYLTLVRTGDLDTMVEPDEAELMNIRRENESFEEGQNPPVLATDRHKSHIQHHAAKIGDPAIRNEGNIVAAGAAHIQEHIKMLRTIDPDLLQLMGETPLVPDPAMAGMRADPGAPPNPHPIMPPDGSGMGGQPQQNPRLPGGQAGPAPAPPPAPGPPKAPGMPKNPATGQKWTPQDGSVGRGMTTGALPGPGQ